MHYPSPPKAMLSQFTKQTGIKVNWVEIGWDDLQTKIAAAATSNSYFADATDVDWSKVGEYAKTGWFLPMGKWFNASSLKPDMPQLDTFIARGQLVGMPFDASFIVTTVNSKDFQKAGVSSIPATLSGFPAALSKVRAHGMTSPLDIHFAAAEGLSTCWYQMTAAFGGQVLDSQGNPLFASSGSPGYKALTWMVNAYKNGLVPKGNINIPDYTGFTTEMAKNRVAAVLCDYSGSVGSIYDVPKTSSVVNQVRYVPTPGVSGPGANIANPDGIGIPKTAKNPRCGSQVHQVVHEHRQPGGLGRSEGPGQRDRRLPAAGPAVQPGHASQIREARPSLRTGGPAARACAGAIPEGAPSWYAQFSNAVYTNIHQAAAGQQTTQQAVKNIASQVSQLKASG